MQTLTGNLRLPVPDPRIHNLEELAQDWQSGDTQGLQTIIDIIHASGSIAHQPEVNAHIRNACQILINRTDFQDMPTMLRADFMYFRGTMDRGDIGGLPNAIAVMREGMELYEEVKRATDRGEDLEKHGYVEGKHQKPLFLIAALRQFIRIAERKLEGREGEEEREETQGSAE